MDEIELRKAMRRFGENSVLLGVLFFGVSGLREAGVLGRVGETIVQAAAIAAYVAFSLLRHASLRQAVSDYNPDRWSRAYLLAVAFVAAFFALTMLLGPSASTLVTTLWLAASAGALTFIGWLMLLYGKATRLDR